MAKVERRLMARGTLHVVECAVREDQETSPASDFLDQLEEGKLKLGLKKSIPKDAQINPYDWIQSALEEFSVEGVFPSRKYNQLKDGIWEIKHLTIRIAFFDTPGDGTYNPKINYSGQTHWKPPELPAFDPIVRLSLGFVKPPDNYIDDKIRLAKIIREEDVSHDR